MNDEKRFDLIAKGTAEIVTQEELKKLLSEKKHPKSYLGIAPTGPPHIGYYRTLAKQIDLVNAGCEHTVLIADLHAYLDDRKSPWSELKTRGEIYKKCFQLLGLKGKNVKYVIGSSFQLKKEYFMETMKSLPLVTVNRAMRAASEVTRMQDPKVSELVYPIMQTLDCWGLDTDIAYGGLDQRHVYMLSRDLLKELGHKVPTIVLTPLGISLSAEGKMSASKKASRLELFASPQEIEEKIGSAFCPAKQIENNPIIEYCKYLIFPRIKQFKVERPEKFGGDVVFKDASEMESAFASGELHPMDLKKAAAKHLIQVLKPIRKYYEKNRSLFKTFEKEESVIKPEEASPEINTSEIDKVIKKHKLDAKIILHPEKAVKSLADHIAVHHDTPEHVLKCLCFVSKGKPLVAMASGDVEIDMKKLEKASKMKDIRMASRDELKNLFGREPGGVDPLTLNPKIPAFLDKVLMQKDYVIGSAGSPYAGLKIKPKEILKVVKAKVVDLS